MHRLAAHFRVNAVTSQAALDHRHLTHQQFADHVGIRRGYWSQIVNRFWPFSQMVRYCMHRSAYLRDIEPGDLWTVEPAA